MTIRCCFIKVNKIERGPLISMNYTKVNISEHEKHYKHIICYKDLPLYYPNQFLNRRGLNSEKTREAYATTLTRFFNFFEDTYGITDFREIKQSDAIERFMHHAIYDSVLDSKGNKKYLYDNETLITPTTANNYMSRIQSFYLSLEKPLKELLLLDSDYVAKLLSQGQKNSIKQKTSYKGIWATLDLSDLNLHANTKWKKKSKTKQSFTLTEVDLLAVNLNNKCLRDECIFLTCLETGSRIDEVLTLYKHHFSKNSSGVWTLYINSSKTKSRYVAVPNHLAKKINNYINTERRRNTQNQAKYERLFVSSKGKSKGKLLGYHTFYNHLKEAGKEAGMDVKFIMTHLSRATKATQMKLEGRTTEEIRIQLGNEIVINPYIDYANPEAFKEASKGIYYLDEC